MSDEGKLPEIRNNNIGEMPDGQEDGGMDQRGVQSANSFNQ